MTEEMRSRLLGMTMARVSRGVFPQRKPIGYLYGHVAKEGESPTHTINGVDYVGVVAPKLPPNHDEFFAEIQAAIDKGDTEDAVYLTDYPYMAVFYDSIRREYVLCYFRLPQQYIPDPDLSYVGRPWDDSAGDNHHLIYRIDLPTKEWRTNIYSDSFILNNGELIWTNHDVINTEDGSIYFAKSGLVYVYEYPPVDRAPKCSYNGTILPELPEWDTKTFPYAFIEDAGSVNGIALYSFSIEPTVILDDKGNPKLSFDNTAEFVQFQLKTDELQWWATPVVKFWDEEHYGFYGYAFPFWSNFDACDSNKKVYLAASDPIPIYE